MQLFTFFTAVLVGSLKQGWQGRRLLIDKKRFSNSFIPWSSDETWQLRHRYHTRITKSFERWTALSVENIILVTGDCILVGFHRRPHLYDPLAICRNNSIYWEQNYYNSYDPFTRCRRAYGFAERPPQKNKYMINGNFVSFLSAASKAKGRTSKLSWRMYVFVPWAGASLNISDLASN